MTAPVYPYVEQLRAAADACGHRGELEQALADAEKYRWLLKHFPTQVAGCAYGVVDACSESEPDAAMTIAVRQKPRGR